MPGYVPGRTAGQGPQPDPADLGRCHLQRQAHHLGHDLEDDDLHRRQRDPHAFKVLPSAGVMEHTFASISDLHRTTRDCIALPQLTGMIKRSLPSTPMKDQSQGHEEVALESISSRQSRVF